MKKALIKTIAASALILGLGSSVFASGRRQSPHDNPMGHNSEWNAAPQKFSCGAMPHEKGGAGMKDISLLGTVSAIDTGKQLVTVKDADGKETQVHVNPFTRLVLFEKPGAPGDGKNANEVKIDDIKVGSWIAVSKFENDTKTLEARRIVVAKE